MALDLDLEMDQGGFFQFKFTVLDEDDVAVGDLTGFGVRCQCRVNIEDTDVAFSLNGDIVTPASSIARIYYDAPDSALVTAGEYAYDIEVYSGSLVYVTHRGILTVKRNNTR